MYKLVLEFERCGSITPSEFFADRRKEFYISTSESVCDILQCLPKGVTFILCEIEFSSVDEVLDLFKPKEI